ncbi:hypothetical protein PHLCEN_2v3569 [Hermanssonia centrifuga]|uniref:DUF6535 domain-containing protein n=1 Tax=Hermanssonia centrifuga TaxID=98765 RepID=A0A2R6QEP7_9APHY|nr:hypothetical protein PHLCEN_2v3569 [Hermanssonia centrifuga]
MSSSDEEDKPKGSGEANPANLKTGWSAIEDYAWKNDEQSMKVFSEDIDTLLVFAGLFSAVLTAFVVPAFAMLQQDNVQVSADILARISAKLDSFQITPSFINSTASHDPSPSPFTVSTSARWINILWFLSLLFSLSSALFGILAKQWIREYLQWNQTTASPRQNIILRQLRSEAWVKWKVPAGIAAIPALLEVAVVLFLVGLIVFVWTLDFVVALVISISAGIILTIAFIITTLPAFFQHCPYKSPTGWACAFIYDMVIRNLYGIRSRFDDSFFHVVPYFPSWRHRDLHISRKLSTEVSDCVEDGMLPWDEDSTTEHIKTIAQMRPLVQALAWAHEGSEDPRLSSEVVRCLDTLLVAGSDDAGWQLQLSGTLYTLWKFCLRDGRMNHFPRVGSLLDAFFDDAGSQIVHVYTLSGGLGVETYNTLIDVGHIWSALRYLGDSQRRLLLNLVLGDLEACLVGKPWDTTVGNERTNKRRRKWIVVHIMLLHDLVWSYSRDFNITDEVCGRLIQMCNRLPTAANAPYPTYLHAILLRFACTIGKVCIGEETRELSENANAAFTLTLQIFDQNTNYADPAARHRFAMMADWLLSRLDWSDEQNPDVLLQKMTEAARISLDNSYLNCGCYHDLPWIKSLLDLGSSDFHETYPQSMSSLFDILDQFKFVDTSSSRPLEYSDLLDESGKVVAVITGEGVKEDYEKAKMNIRRYLDRVNRYRSPSRGPDDLAGDDGEGVIGVADGHPDPCNTPGDDGPSKGTGQEEAEVGATLDAISASSGS